MWAAQRVAANGIELNVYRSGGDLPPVVLLHGVTDGGKCWIRLAQQLEADYDLIMIDARGHGLSDKPETGYSYADHAADVAGVIDALGLDRPVVIGHSMGAGTAAQFGASYPDRVRALVLEDPPWWAEATPLEVREANAAAARDNVAQLQAQTLDELIAARRATAGPVWDEIEFGPWAETKFQVSLNALELMSALGESWRDVAQRITCPVLLVTADPELAAIVTPAVAEEAQRLMASCRVAHLAGAGHNVRREQFEPYVDAVRAFLAGLT